jgi:hypothetical protein
MLFLLILYVDDILLFATFAEIERVQTFMEKEFKWIFLCTRVTKPTKVDQRKLLQVIGYLKQTSDSKNTIAPNKPLQVIA